MSFVRDLLENNICSVDKELYVGCTFRGNRSNMIVICIIDTLLYYYNQSNSYVPRIKRQYVF